MLWTKKSPKEIREHVFSALEKNKNFNEEFVLGIPGSYLDPKVFNQDNRLLENAPFLTTMVSNPNHIGCHTMGSSESFFQGTHEIEREVIRICAEDIFKAEEGMCDGYVASGGTEANIQALWIYRNYFMHEFGAKADEIAVLCSENSHYSMAKGANVLGINLYQAATDKFNLEVIDASLDDQIERAQKDGIKYFIVLVNMMTTMFGSVDNPEQYARKLEAKKLPFKVHVDAAFGGFYYPFSNKTCIINFENKLINSITMDAHKMAQAPYGTGIFLIRKGFMKYATTKEASYVEGEDSTLIGSRSGANAVAIWMILSTYGRYGWMEKIFILQKRTDWLCEQLKQLGVQFYRNPFSNIVTIRHQFISKELAEKYNLVPDNHHAANWYKIVVMDHVLVDKLEVLLNELRTELEHKALH